MPNKDGTGPRGFGPLTGRGLGPCGKGSARCFGRGFGKGQQVNFSKEEKIKILEAELEELKDA